MKINEIKEYLNSKKDEIVDYLNSKKDTIKTASKRALTGAVAASILATSACVDSNINETSKDYPDESAIVSTDTGDLSYENSNISEISSESPSSEDSSQNSSEITSDPSEDVSSPDSSSSDISIPDDSSISEPNSSEEPSSEDPSSEEPSQGDISQPEDPYKSTEYQIIEGITEEKAEEHIIVNWLTWYPFNLDLTQDEECQIKSVYFENFNGNPSFGDFMVNGEKVRYYLLKFIIHSPKLFPNHPQGKPFTLNISEHDVEDCANFLKISKDELLRNVYFIKSSGDQEDEKILSALFTLVTRSRERADNIVSIEPIL